MIYPNDHRPAHVHVIGGGCEAVFKLHCPDGPPELRENFGFTRKDLSAFSAALMTELHKLCDEWGHLHDDF
ncbi:DUF4160 domain-containing protein [Thauera aromatica]|uniref:DUF4160 domain-containing protein n=1 Tax=Thauera aromatica K172 TaxID=44139 RepID=A0A2R4BIL2_THAAR|nr:DUF4160 domain-containing protein [Thauera aromatica]AVR87161.1 hypothetical protein Tharo_0210 [Thauera aromatica K172]